MNPKNTICLWFNKIGHDVVRFYAATFPDSKVTAFGRRPLTTRAARREMCDGGIYRSWDSLSRYQRRSGFQAQRGLLLPDRDGQSGRDGPLWNAIVGNGGEESQCGWCKDRWGLSWQITPRALTDAMAAGGGEAKRAFEAMMPMKKIDIATIEAARRG